MPEDSSQPTDQAHRLDPPMYCPECDRYVREDYDPYDEGFHCPECSSSVYESKENYIEILHATARWEKENGWGAWYDGEEDDELVTDGGEDVTAGLQHAEAEVVIQKDYLDRYLRGLNALVDEVVFDFDNDGITAESVDPANVARVNLTIPKTMMVDYDTDGVKVGFNIYAVRQVLDELDTEKVRLAVSAPEYSLTIATPKVEHTRDVLDPDKVRDQGDNGTWITTAAVEVPAKELQEALTLVYLNSEYIIIEYREDGEFALSTETSLTETVYKPDEYDVKEEGDAWSKYSIDYVMDIIEEIDPEDTVRLTLGNEVPLAIEVPYATGGGLEWIVAPRIGGEN